MIYQPKNSPPPTALLAGIAIVAFFSIGSFEIGREFGHADSETELFHARRLLRAAQSKSRNLIHCDNSHPEKMFGHIHMAKTGGSNVNGILSAKYERVCGNKGYSFNAYHENAIRENHPENEFIKKGKTIVEIMKGSDERANPDAHGMTKEMEKLGFEDCDYVSHEWDWTFWRDHFGSKRFHNVDMELHVPCRDPVEHLMSQCNHDALHRGRVKFQCEHKTDQELFAHIQHCLVSPDRYNNQLEQSFNVRCYDFEQQFTTYIDHMANFLEERRFEPEHYSKKETNSPRDRDSECIWDRPNLMEKARKYLIENVQYYNFCNRCMGTEKEITRSVGEGEGQDEGVVAVAAVASN
mmetsp:Transcript_4167/g.9265  ORF Transcript_4167/g.9265 Transcript_4167/m.9265 type:complete len:352 (+) Transcript_4167:91-1146(+)|eukprot:CAMPEP_0183707944 /NCGR_PEP_ID=MMETSP0737-20130205/4360_1 /TAXON_ID=385413 /ORGANISM="Thalassiosira miniscula, Strain CCMP1093" /LENGTH=351 /DNA_ID=CAMNT_0025935707 /DNA_START=34 /DNA_END=1089 /DNA_ORIENTATION=+